MLDEKKIQSHLIAMKAAANVMLAEAAKVERMLSERLIAKKVDVEFERYRTNRMKTRLKKAVL